MTTDFPKLLVATEFPPNGGGGSGTVVRQMLKGWPVDRLGWWSCRAENDQKFGQNTAFLTTATLPSKLSPNLRWCAQKSWLLEHFWAPWAASHLRKTISRFQPDVVWAIPASASTFPLARILARTDARSHVSVHDYPDTQGGLKRFGVDRCRRMSALVDDLYRNATTRDATSKPMVEDFRSRLGAEGDMNCAGLEPEDFEYLAGKDRLPSGPVRIAYAGTIIVEEEFALLVSALEKIRKHLPRPVSLEFFSHHSYYRRAWFNREWMVEHGVLPTEKLTDRLRQEFTWGFIPMNLTEDNARYSHFSMPIKFISYLQAGLPVIALGHPKCSLMQTIGDNRIGLHLTDSNSKSLAERLLAGLSTSEPWSEYGSSLLKLARNEFDARKMRQVLWGKLTENA